MRTPVAGAPSCGPVRLSMQAALFSTLDDRVGRILIRLYIKQVIYLKLVNILMVLSLVYVIWGRSPEYLLLGWLALQLLLMLVELVVIYLFKRRARKFSSAVWRLMLSVPAVFVGIAWGAAAPLFLDASDPVNMISVSMLLLGVLSGSLYTFSLLPPLYYLFAGMILLQYLSVTVFQPGLEAVSVGALGLALLSAGLSYQLYRITYELLFSRYKNKAYAHELKHAKRIAEQASMAKTRFLASASHDIRQPLQAMALYAEALACRINRPDNIKNLEGLRQSHASMSRIMNSLLDISKLDADIIEPDIGAVALQPLMEHLLGGFHSMAKKKGLTMRCRVADDICVRSDAALLERIVSNLLGNALRYTDSGGILAACRRRGQAVALEIWDTGRGIPAGQVGNVFLEFYQLENPERDRHKGLGLGLSIVKRLTQLLPGHSIDLCSIAGRGSRFRLTMPVASSNVVKPDRLRERPQMVDQLLGMKVLVIEDDASVRNAMVALMQSWECRVCSAGDVAGAIECMEGGWVPGAIVADYRLPGGKTGIQAIQAIRSHLQQYVPALIVTGESLPETLQDIQSQEDVLLLHKPVQAARLKMFLRRYGRNF